MTARTVLSISVLWIAFALGIVIHYTATGTLGVAAIYQPVTGWVEAPSGAALVTRSLEYYYEPWRDSGSTIQDLSTHNRDLTLSGDAVLGTNGLTCDGNADFAWADHPTVTDPQALSGATGGTVIVVAEYNGTAIAGQELYIEGSNTKMDLRNSSLELRPAFNVGGSFSAANSTADLSGAFHMIVARYDGSNVELLRDGSTSLVTQGGYSGTITDSADDLYMCNQSTSSLDGVVAGLYFYSDDLTDAELDDMLAYIKSTYPAGVVGDLP